MRDAEQFDEFYLAARQRLLLQTYALTGDLAAARRAVRDAFIYAWHHWAKLSKLPAPEDAVRPNAWRHAQRRHAARMWHREKDISSECQETLGALLSLDLVQRRALVLTHLSSVSLPELAREIGRPPADAEQMVQQADIAFAAELGISTASVHRAFDALREPVEATLMPRPSIIRRAGATRRRSQTALGLAAAVAALVAAGSVVTADDGVRPSLQRVAPVAVPGEPDPTDEPEGTAQLMLDESRLLGPPAMSEATSRKGWKVESTNDNSSGNGLVLPCQQERYADPDGTAAFLRTFAGSEPRGSRPPASAFTMVEKSPSPKAAKAAYRRASRWYAGCDLNRAQLLATRSVAEVGESARLITLRQWRKQPRTIAVGLSRTGNYLATTMTVVNNIDPANVQASARLIEAAVGELCDLPDSGKCAKVGKVGLDQVDAEAPLPTGDDPAMLSVIDLPRVTGVDRAWAATDPVRAKNNVAATRCDKTEFTGKVGSVGFTRNKTRSFLIPEAKNLPPTFGLTQTVGRLPKKQATQLVEGVRDKLRECEGRDLGTDVRDVTQLDNGPEDLSVWQLSTRVSENRSLNYFMAILRASGAVSQLTFIPAGDTTMREAEFVNLAKRAQERLRELPASSKKAKNGD